MFSFFLASTEMAGWSSSWKARTCRLMYSNWASRSAWSWPSLVFRLACRLYPKSSSRAASLQILGDDAPCRDLDLRQVQSRAKRKKKDALTRGRQVEPTGDGGSPSNTEVLLFILRRLEMLERDIQGTDLGKEDRNLIDRAIEVLRRLQDVAGRREVVA